MYAAEEKNSEGPLADREEFFIPCRFSDRASLMRKKI